MLAQTLVLGKISFSVLSFWYYHILFYTKCDYQIKNSKFQEFLVFWFLSFVFLTNWMSRFQESNSLIRNSQFLNFSYLGILEFAMNVGFSQNGFSANKIPSFQIPSFVIPTKTFLVLSFPVSCVNRTFKAYDKKYNCRWGHKLNVSGHNKLATPDDILIISFSRIIHMKDKLIMGF